MKREHDRLGNCNIGQHAIAKALGFLKALLSLAWALQQAEKSL